MPNKTYKTYKRKKQSGKSSKVQVGGWVCDKYKKQLKELQADYDGYKKHVDHWLKMETPAQSIYKEHESNAISEAPLNTSYKSIYSIIKPISLIPAKGSDITVRPFIRNGSMVVYRDKGDKWKLQSNKLPLSRKNSGINYKSDNWNITSKNNNPSFRKPSSYTRVKKSWMIKPDLNAVNDNYNGIYVHTSRV